MTDAMAMGFLLKSLSYGIPGAILAVAFLVFLVLTKFQKEKSDLDRKEHMSKWDSMLIVQKDTTMNIIAAHKDEMNRLIDNHKEELDRMLRVNERQAQSMESMAHNLTVLSRAIEVGALPFSKDK